MDGWEVGVHYDFRGIFDTDSVIEVVNIQEPSASPTSDFENSIRDIDFEPPKEKSSESEYQTTE